jgi:hypothetical protein
MNCFSIAALAMRLAVADPHTIHAEPGLSISMKCGIEIGGSWRDDAPVVDIGFKFYPSHRFWVRGGFEVDYRQRIRITGGLATAHTKRQPRTIIETDGETIEARPRLSVGFDVPVGRYSIIPEFETTRGGKFIISIARTF